MIKIFTFIICLVALASASHSYSFQYCHQRYLVVGQTGPVSFQATGVFPMTESGFKSSGSEYDLEQKNISIYSSFLPVLSNDTKLLVFGGGYVQDSYNDIELETGLPQKMKGAYINFFGTGSIGDRWFLFTYHQYGRYSNSLKKSGSEADNLLSLLTLGYKKSANLSLQGGFILISDFGDVIALPAVFITYSTKSWMVNAILPKSVEFRRFLQPELHFVIQGQYDSFGYYEHNADDVITYQGWELSLSMEYKPLKYTWFQIGLKGDFLGEYRWRDKDEKLGSIDSVVSAFAALIIRME